MPRRKNCPGRDCLGRPIRHEADPGPRCKRLLTDDEISTIAHEVRTRPLSEVGRHVMPLIAHISEVDRRLFRMADAVSQAAAAALYTVMESIDGDAMNDAQVAQDPDKGEFTWTRLVSEVIAKEFHKHLDKVQGD